MTGNAHLLLGTSFNFSTAPQLKAHLSEGQVNNRAAGVTQFLRPFLQAVIFHAQ